MTACQQREQGPLQGYSRGFLRTDVGREHLQAHAHGQAHALAHLHARQLACPRVQLLRQALIALLHEVLPPKQAQSPSATHIMARTYILQRRAMQGAKQHQASSCSLSGSRGG
jgi:hypothetical protein